MLLRALPLAAVMLVAPLCGGEDPVAVLERQKEELLETTVEKKEFWAQVERKGEAAKRLKALREEQATIQAELAVLEARRAAAEPSLASAREVNGRAEAVKAEVEEREAELDAALRELEAMLGRWKQAASAQEPG